MNRLLFLTSSLARRLLQPRDWGWRIATLVAAVLIGDWAGTLVCRQRLYHELSRDFILEEKSEDADTVPKPNSG